MLPERDHAALTHMRDHAREAVTLTGAKSKPELETDRVLSLALVRLLEIVGEAAGRVSPATRATHPAIAWAQIIGMRNRLIHGYDSVDLGILWQIIHNDLPTLAAQVDRIIA